MNIAERVKKGEVLKDILIIDCHAHMDKVPVFSIYGDSSCDGMVRLMDRIGIDKFIVSHHLSVGPDYRPGNDIVYAAIKKYPERILGYIGVNPHYPDEILPELKQRLKQGFVGIKIHPGTHNYKATDNNYHIAYEFAQQNKLFLLSHTWGYDTCNPKLFIEIAKKYPDVKFLLAHAGGGDRQGIEESIEAVKKCGNIYIDITCSLLSAYWLEEMVRQIGDERILFGTDCPFLDPRYDLGTVLLSGISDRSKGRILGLNMKKILEGK
jgi:predicted TIM-barrel fold metal-dependent hydrolase